MATKSVARAQKLAEQYNRETAQIDALQLRLYQLTQKHRATYAAAMDALPEGTSMLHGGGRGLEVTMESADAAVSI